MNLKFAVMKSKENDEQIESVKNVVYRLLFWLLLSINDFTVFK